MPRAPAHPGPENRPETRPATGPATRHFRPAVWLALLLAWLSATAQAGGFSVLPTRLQFSAERAVQSVVLTNTSAQTISVEAQVLLWPEEAAGQLASDLVVTPAVVTLPPGQRARIRVGLLRPGDGRAERAYRLYLTELPAPTPLQGAGIGVRLRLGLPVFVAPLQPAPQTVAWRVVRAADGPPGLEAFNAGNVHARVVQAQLTTDQGDVALNLPSPYLLAGARLRLPLPPTTLAGPALKRVRWLDGDDARDSPVALD